MKTLLYLSFIVSPIECNFYQEYGEISMQDYHIEHTLTYCEAVHNASGNRFEIQKNDIIRVINSRFIKVF